MHLTGEELYLGEEWLTSSKDETATNIATAFKVVLTTYQNVEKLLNELDAIAARHKFSSISPKFLRYRSDAEIAGWLVTDIIKLYMYEQKGAARETLFSGPVYSIEVSLVDAGAPKLVVGKYFYKDGEGPRSFAISPGDHWKYNWPVVNNEKFKIRSWKGKWNLSTPLTSSTTQMGLTSVVFTKLDLVDINSVEAVDELVFSVLDELVPIEAPM